MRLLVVSSPSWPLLLLRELSGVQQIKGEPMRRWFYDHEIDLVIWQDDAGEIISFQLAYDKTLNEHSLFWHREREQPS